MTKTERNLGGTAPRYLAILVAAVLGLSLFPAAAFAAHNPNNTDPCAGAPVANEYVDRDEAAETHRPSIDCVIYRSIAIGSTNDSGQQVYNPDQNVTRGQMASFIAQTIDAAGYGSRLSDGQTDRFSDVSGNTHRLNINRLADANIVRGVGGNRYAPNQLVSRQQMATFIVAAARFAVGDDHPVTRDAADQFVDVSNSNVHKANIEAGADANPVLFRGVTPTQFNPRVNVPRDQMASFLVNLLRYTFNPGTAPNPDPVSVEIENTDPVTPGEPILVEILASGDDEIVSASVDDQGDTDADTAAAQTDNCLVSEGAVADTEPETEGIQASLDTREDFTGDSCTLVFTITTRNSNGEESTTTVEITVSFTQPETPTGNTDRPELVSAEIIEVDTTGTDAGITVRYTFDELLESVEDQGDESLFYVYEGADPNNPASGDGIFEVDDDDNAVDIFFDDYDSQSEADALSLATVDFGAVQDEANLENPIGDAPLNEEAGGDTTLPAGITTAPDLLEIELGNEITTGTDIYETTWTFDEDVAAVVNRSGFWLVFDDGEQQVNCVAQEVEPDDEDVDVECDLSGLTGGQDEGDIERGYVEIDTVSDDEDDADPDAPPAGDTGTVGTTTGNTNPLQAAEVDGSNGNTATPDIVSAQFFPRGDNEDQVAVTWDEPVDDCNDANFFIYYEDGTETSVGALATDACENDTSRVILLTLDDDDLEDAVGVSARQGAVTETDAANRDNLPDEVGVENTTEEIASGFTAGPDLIEVNVEEDTSTTGTVRGLVATYTFDEDVYLDDETLFFLLEEDGTRYQSTDCDFDDDVDEPTVTCTQYEEFDDPGTDIDQDDEEELIDNAVLGTVDDEAVNDEDAAAGDYNPEGAEAVTDAA